MTTKDDQMEVFGVLELVLPLGDAAPDNPMEELTVENQTLVGHAPGDGTMRFRFCPKTATTYGFTIKSNVVDLDGKKGGITAIEPRIEIALQPSSRFPNWWTDDPSPELAEGEHDGAKSVSRWRVDYLQDFSKRMARCQAPNRQ